MKENEMEEQTYFLENTRVEENEEKIAAKLMRGFKPPVHSNKCKLCYGRGYIGFIIDPKTKERKKAICPKYEAEVSIALKIHVSKMEQFYAARESLRAENGTAFEQFELQPPSFIPKSFDSMIKGS